MEQQKYMEDLVIWLEELLPVWMLKYKDKSDINEFDAF